MNYNGCKRKFDIAKYVSYVNGVVREAKGGAPASAVAGASSSAAVAGAKAAPKKGTIAAAFNKKAATKEQAKEQKVAKLEECDL